MRKSLLVLLVVLLTAALVFTGCSQNAPSSESSSGAQDTAKTSASADQSSGTGEAGGYVIGFSNFSVGNSWRVQMEAEFKAAADSLKAQGVISEYIMTDSNGDISKQIADMNDLITKGVDAIIITAASPSALSAVCEQAIDEGIVVVSFDNYVDTDKVTAKVGIDEKEFGRTGAQFIVDQLNGQGKIVVLNGMAGTGTNQLRYDGAKEVFDANPGIEILGEAFADWDYAKGKTAVEGFLSAYPQIDAVWSQGGAMTQAAVDAFVAAERPLVPMAAEANNGMLKEWKQYADQGLTSIAPCCPTYVSASALEVAIQALKGETVEKTTYIELPVITQDNLDEYVKPDLPDSYWNITKLSDEQVAELFSK